MKIALICTEKLPVPPVSGGAVQIYIEGILPELSKQHDITVFSIKHESLKDEEEVDGVKYIRVAANNKTEYIKNIKSKLDDSYDLIHVFNRPKWVVSLGRYLPNTKFSLSLHNEMFHKEKISDEAGLECVNRVEFITTVSKFIADGVRQRFPEADKKLNPVYSGVDINKFKPAFSNQAKKNKETLKKELGIEDKKVVLFVGRLGEKKGAEKLIAAMKSVMDVRSDVALVIIGSKWYGRNTMDDYTNSVVAMSKSLNGPVIFTGYLSQEQIPKYFNVGDIFVCPSQWREPLARVHYEAMAAGLPIITTNRGGNKEVIEGYDNGIVIDDYSNPDAFSDQIITLLDDPKKASAMGLKGRKLAEEKYNWNRVANDLLKLLNSVGDAKASEQALPEETTEAESKPSDTEKPDNAIKTEPIIEVKTENNADVSAEKIKEPKKDLPKKSAEIESKPLKAEKADDVIKKEQVVETKIENIPDVPAEKIKDTHKDLPKKSAEIESKPLEVEKADDVIKKEQVVETKNENTPDVPAEKIKDTKKDLPKKSAEIDSKPLKSEKTEVMKKNSCETIIKAKIKNTPDISAKKAKESKETITKEAKQQLSASEITHDEFIKWIMKKYPCIPIEVAEYLERYKENLLRGDL